MKKILISLCLLANIRSGAQTYIAFEPTFTTSAGSWASRSNIAIEAGRQWDVFSLGIDLGKTNFTHQNKRDTTTYMELRPNLNIFQQGKWTNTVTIGVGYIFNAQNNFLCEFTNGIEYSLSDKVHINIMFGQYYFSGPTASFTPNFIGISIDRFFLPTKTKGILNK